MIQYAVQFAFNRTPAITGYLAFAGATTVLGHSVQQNMRFGPAFLSLALSRHG
jgi:hypothetical protein